MNIMNQLDLSFFFFFKQKTAYEIGQWLEFRRVLFRSPFPTHEVRALVQRHASAREVCWVQEEPANQGAWWFVRPLLSPLLRPDVRFSYIGRVEAAGVATGSYQIHQAEEQAILEQALER